MVRQLIKAVPICGKPELHNSALLYSVFSLLNSIHKLISLTPIVYNLLPTDHLVELLPVLNFSENISNFKTPESLAVLSC